MEKFAGYGFNKSHSAAYALLSYQTAYLKAHYPAQFMAAVLSADMDHTDKVVTLIKECSDMGLAVLPPDVNASRLRVHRLRRAQHPLRPGRGARRGRGARSRRCIAERERARPVPLARGPVPPAGPAEGQPARARGAAALAAASMRLGAESRHAHGSVWRRHAARRPEHARARRPGRTICSASAATSATLRSRAQRAARAARVERGGAPGRASARRSACTSPGIRWRASRRACRASSRTASATW